ncbi:hypothetical protein [Laceyella putida]|uniref:Uncharacterized protein n=1 Tax=Laceyella putida TaxID=110101 RepID=A0ABW2RH55_9BACL
MSHKGLVSHDHGLRVWEQLYHEYWNVGLMKEVNEEIEGMMGQMEAHIKEGCSCGDNEQDTEFFRKLKSMVQRGIQAGDISELPVVEEALQQYFLRKHSHHPCIRHLLHTRHEWGWDRIVQIKRDGEGG